MSEGGHSRSRGQSQRKHGSAWWRYEQQGQREDPVNQLFRFHVCAWTATADSSSFLGMLGTQPPDEIYFANEN